MYLFIENQDAQKNIIILNDIITFVFFFPQVSMLRREIELREKLADDRISAIQRQRQVRGKKRKWKAFLLCDYDLKLFFYHTTKKNNILFMNTLSFLPLQTLTQDLQQLGNEHDRATIAEREGTR